MMIAGCKKVDVEFENVPDEVVIEYGSRYIFYFLNQMYMYM